MRHRIEAGSGDNMRSTRAVQDGLDGFRFSVCKKKRCRFGGEGCFGMTSGGGEAKFLLAAGGVLVLGILGGGGWGVGMGGRPRRVREGPRSNQHQLTASAARLSRITEYRERVIRPY